MKLTKLQFKILRVWLRYHNSGCGISQWISTYWKQWVLLAAFGLFAYYFAVPEVPAVGWGYWGICFGVILRDIGYYQVSRRTWLITDQVIDWKRVQELVDSHDKPAA